MLTPYTYEQEEGGVVSEVQFVDKKRHPLIVSFQNGKLLPDASERLQCGMYREKSSRQRIVAVATDTCVYRGTPASNTLCRTLLCIRNKITNKVRLIEVESVNLTPFVNCQKPSSEVQDRLEAYSELNKKFGSKRIKRRVEQKEAMQLEVDHMEKQMSQALKETAKNELIDPKSEENALKHGSSPAISDEVLPCDRNATSPDKIYNINDFISKDELDSFQTEAQKLAAERDPDSSYSAFFLSCFKQVPPETCVQCIKILLYAECLVRFINLTYKDLRAKNVVVCKLSESVNKRILNSFTVPSDSGRTRPLHVRDKAICHVIALGLLANNFKLNLGPLLESIKIGGTRLQQLCKAIGAMPTPGNKNLVVLKAPLPPLTQNTPGRGAGRARRGGR